MNRSSVFAAILVAMCVLFSGAALAQTTYGSIEGRVVDKSGAVLPRVTVIATQIKTGISRTTQTNAEGLYRALNLNTGDYDVSAELNGFSKAIRRGVKVDVGQTAALDLSLDVAAAEQTVDVTASAPLLNSGTAEVSRLVAGIAVNATSVSQNNFLLDGVDATRIDDFYPSNGFERGSRLQSASVESIEEFRVMTSNYSAEYGRAAGAVMSAVTKSGGNTFHGSGYGFFRNDRFDARNYFDRTSKPPFDMKQYGGSLGGPIRRDRLFFFNNYEGSLKDLGATASGTVPSDAFRATVNSALGPILASIPHATGTTSNANVGTISYAQNTHIRENVYSARVDAKLSDRNSVYARYNIQDSLVDGPQYVVFASALSGQQQYVPIRTQSFTSSYLSILRPNLMNEAKFGLNRFASRIGQLDPNSPAPIPQTTITGVSVVPGITGDSQQKNMSFEYIDNLSWYHGIQTIKTGVNIRRIWDDFTQGATTAITFPSLAALAANQVSQATFSPAIPLTHMRGWNYAAYLQDDIKATRRLTINAGVRYDYIPPFTDQDHRLQNLGVTTMSLTPGGAQLYKPDRNNIAPRLGFTYALRSNGETVLGGGYGIYYAAYAPANVQNLLTGNAPGATLLTRTQIPTLSYPVASFASGFSNAPTRRATDPNRKDVYNEQVTVNVQQQLGPNTVATLGYVGNWSRNNERTRPLNLIDPTTKLRPNTALSQVLFAESSGSADYNALQTSITRRMSHGLAFNANYTYSKLMDDIVSPQNPFAPWSLEWTHGTREVPHNFSFNAAYDLPFGKGKPWMDRGGLANGFLGGWQLNGIVLARSGLPYTVTLGSVTESGTGWTTNQRPNVVPGVDHVGTIIGATGWLNPAAFSTPALGTFGNLGRNTQRGPKFVQVDTSLFKNLHITERQNLQLRVEAFNILNRAQFPSAPTANFLAPSTFGQFFSTFGRTEGFGTSRQIQFAVRYSF